MSDSRFVIDSRFNEESEAESSKGLAGHTQATPVDDTLHEDGTDAAVQGEGAGGVEDAEDESQDGLGDGMMAEGFSGPSEKVVKPLTPEDLAKYKSLQEKTGVVYISRIPPGMRPTKVRHLMSQYGEIGRVYLQPEGASFLNM